MSRVNFL